MDNKKNRFHFKHLITLFILGLVITLNWFKDGYLFATAEEGIPFYSPARTTKMDSSVWQSDNLGFINSTILPRWPTMKTASLLNEFLSPNIVQAILFFVIIFSALSGCYILTKHYTRSGHISLFASIFYLMNIFTMSQVFARALYVLMFSWAFLPWFIYLYVNALEKRGYRWLGLFLLIQIIFSYSYIFPTSIFAFWIPAFLIYLFNVLKNIKETRLIILLTRKTILIGILWCMVNIWWLFPFLKLANSAGSINTNPLSNLESLQAVSTSFPVSQIVQLRQKNYFNYSFNKNLSWDNFYDSKISYLLTFSVLLIVILGFIKFKANKNYYLLISTLLLALIISKGTNEPFGNGFYGWLFKNLSFTAIFRNSYEKFGSVFLLYYSIFFGIGMAALLGWIRGAVARWLFIFLSAFLIFGLLVNPMWSGKVFWKYYWVEVPKYYNEVNDILNKDNSDFRILILPQIPTHGISYRWGYKGDEPSRYFFDKDVISKRLFNNYIKIYDEISNNIKDHKNIDSLLEISNIKYLIVNYDIEHIKNGPQDPSIIESYLVNQRNIEFLQKKGNLAIFKYKNAPASKFKVSGIKTYYPSYARLKNSHYRVYLKNVNAGDNLIFLESFDKNWIAKSRIMSFADHSRVYDYANNWKIIQAGDYEIDVSFKVWPWE